MQESASSGYYGNTSLQKTHTHLYSETGKKQYNCTYCENIVSSYPSCHNCGEELCQFSNCAKYFEVHSCFTPLNSHPCHKTFPTDRHSQQHYNSHVNSVITSSNMPLDRIPELQQRRFPGIQRKFLNYHPSEKPFSSNQHSQQCYSSFKNSDAPRSNTPLNGIPELLQTRFPGTQTECLNYHPSERPFSSNQQSQQCYYSPENNIVPKSNVSLDKIPELLQTKFPGTHKEFINCQPSEKPFVSNQHCQQYYYSTENSVVQRSNASLNRIPQQQGKRISDSQCEILNCHPSKRALYTDQLCQKHHYSPKNTDITKSHLSFNRIPNLQQKGFHGSQHEFLNFHSSQSTSTDQYNQQHYYSHTNSAVPRSNVPLYKTHELRQKRFQCSQCNWNFDCISKLEQHFRTHTGERPFVCDVSDKNCRYRKISNDHMKTHTGEKPFKCDVCNRSFRRQSILNNHIKTHTGEKPFMCNVCSQNFRRKHHLKTHMRTHTVELPYIYNTCGRSLHSKI